MSAAPITYCEDCSEVVKITLGPYGSGVMVAISCPNCGESYDTNIEPESISWGELAELNHAGQLDRFGFCLCEDPEDPGDLPYPDCPRYAGNGERVSVNDSGLFTDLLGRFGYRAWLSGAYVCYSCGHLCDPAIHGWDED